MPGDTKTKQTGTEVPLNKINDNLLIEKKVIFLDEENLDKIHCYKAIVKLKRGFAERSEIHIILTGLSSKPAKNLYDNLKTLPENEVYGDNTSTINSK